MDKDQPDLTRAEPETLDDSGGPIVRDQDGPEIYGTLYSIGLSAHDPETIWTDPTTVSCTYRAMAAATGGTSRRPTCPRTRAS